MGRRGNNEGNIKKRSDGRWEARITLENGARKSFYGKTRQDVARQLTEALRDRAKGLPIVTEQQTVTHYLLVWLETMKPVVKPRTWMYYRSYVHIHVLPALGKVQLSRLTAQHLQQLYAQKLAAGLSSTTVHHLHAVLHKALHNAVRLGLVQRNVADLVDRPRQRHVELAYLSPEQAQRLLATAVGDRLEALYVLALTTGMREGELLALRWHDVDLAAATLQVRATLQCLGGRLELAEPKSARSRRRIALSAVAVTALQGHWERQQAERQLLGPVWDTASDLVFPNSIGKPINPSNLVCREFHPLLKKAGLPRMRFHDLRHTAASLLLNRGVNIKVVSEMLGHADVSMTLRVYAHVMPHMQQAAASIMDDIFDLET
jgi:integrase